VTHYDIDLTFQPRPGSGTAKGCSTVATTSSSPGTITATTTITANAPVALRSFGLDFKGLTVNGVTVNGTAATWKRLQDTALDSYKLVITPAAPVTGTFTVVVRYSGTPETYLFHGGFDMLQGWLPDKSYCDGPDTRLPDGGFTGVGQPAGTFTWYPNNSTPDDKATYTTRLTAPTGWSAVGVGRLTAKTAVAGGQTQWVWDETMPTTTFLTLASFGQFTEQTASITAGGKTIPVWAYTAPALDQGMGGWTTLRQQLTDIVTWGVGRFGPYPPDAAGYVLAPLGVGWALETQGRPLMTQPFHTADLVHEYVHQWAGNSVTVADWSDLWMPEGFATYAQWLWTEDHGGDKATAMAQWTWFNQPYNSAYWWFAPGKPKADQLWGKWTYYGGAIAWAALRAGVGDATFDQIVKTWLSRYQNSTCSTAQFVALAQEISGRDLSRWQTDWLNTAARPGYWPDTTTFPRTTLAWPTDFLAVFLQLMQQLTALLAVLTPLWSR